MNLMNIYQKKRELQFQTKKEKAAAAEAKYQTKFSRKRKVFIQLNLFKVIHIHFDMFLAIHLFVAMTKDYKMLTSQFTVFHSRGNGYKCLDTT